MFNICGKSKDLRVKLIACLPQTLTPAIKPVHTQLDIYIFLSEEKIWFFGLHSLLSYSNSFVNVLEIRNSYNSIIYE